MSEMEEKLGAILSDPQKGNRKNRSLLFQT